MTTYVTSDRRFEVKEGNGRRVITEGEHDYQVLGAIEASKIMVDVSNPVFRFYSFDTQGYVTIEKLPALLEKEQVGLKLVARRLDDTGNPVSAATERGILITKPLTQIINS